VTGSSGRDCPRVRTSAPSSLNELSLGYAASWYSCQTTESLASADPIEYKNVARVPVVSRWLRERRPLSKRAVRSMLVVMPRVGSDDVLEMAAAEDQEVVEAFATEAADPALGVRSRPGRPHRRLDYPDAFGAEDLIEVAGELAVAVTDKEPRLDALGFELHEQVARLLGHPPPSGFVVIPAR
jgi:hypothetical protein